MFVVVVRLEVHQPFLEKNNKQYHIHFMTRNNGANSSFITLSQKAHWKPWDNVTYVFDGLVD